MEERHKLLLIKQNPLWSGENTDTPTFKRSMYSTIKKYIEYKQIIAVIGIRRIGKTVLLKQMLKEIKSEPKNICYISFDDRDFQNYETASELIDYFLQNSDKEKKRYLFLDEIQKIPNWHDMLKVLYDTEKNLKIIVSGSSSLEFRSYKETLAGRILTFHMPIFTFKEFIRYHNMDCEAGLKNINKEYDLKFLSKKAVYQKMFEKYIIKGAFPELIEIDDEEYIRKYIREVIGKIIIDASRNIGLGKENELNELIMLLSRSTGNLFEINNLSSILKLNRNTVSKYIDLLEKAFLIKVSYNCTKSVAKRLRVGKKCYIAHSAVPIAALNYPFDITSIEGSDLGHLIETIIAGSIDDISFWRQQIYEIDIILKDKTPIEVKYQSRISKNDYKTVLEFMKKAKIKRGFVITKDAMDIVKENGCKIFLVPAWLFLLIDF